LVHRKTPKLKSVISGNVARQPERRCGIETFVEIRLAAFLNGRHGPETGQLSRTALQAEGAAAPGQKSSLPVVFSPSTGLPENSF
jgi:hypothetical protein